MGTIALAYISLRPDAFQLNALGGDIPFVVNSQQFQVHSWLGNSTSELPVEPLNVTFYIWPILCSLSVHNVNAWVHSNGDTRLERTNFNMTLANSTTPLIKPMVPSDPMVTSWSYIVDLLFAKQLDGRSGEDLYLGTPPWLEQSLNQTWSLTGLEDWLSNFAAFYYSFLVQHWRTNVSMLGLRIQPGAVMDGSVMDMIFLLRGSSLPGIIAGDDDEDLGRDGRRRRAERTMVMYKNSTLDVPERFDSEAHEKTGLQSSLRMITPPEELDFINSGDHETTDLQNSMRTITLAERLEDEPLLSILRAAGRQ
ncbi:hypothetical protein BS47DRAFT_1346874, partial [Hydnum rufescens UP504]